LKFFVSGKIGEQGGAIEAMDALRDAGHVITFDWTTIPHLKPYDETVNASREAALKEAQGVADADAVVLIAHESGVGMFIEMGMALALGKPIYVVTARPSRSMFFHHPLVQRFAALKDLLQFLT
jgi:hypothetical protein